MKLNPQNMYEMQGQLIECIQNQLGKRTSDLLRSELFWWDRQINYLWSWLKDTIRVCS